MIAVIQIGNSDNKLTQGEWANYVAATRTIVQEYAFEIHFDGRSDGDAPWQNSCWVIDIFPRWKADFVAAIRALCASYGQDSIAVMFGEPQMIGPRVTTDADPEGE